MFKPFRPSRFYSCCKKLKQSRDKTVSSAKERKMVQLYTARLAFKVNRIRIGQLQLNFVSI